MHSYRYLNNLQKYSIDIARAASISLLLTATPGFAVEVAYLSGAEQYNPGGEVQGSGWANLYDPVTNNMRVLPYLSINGMAIHQGDILLGPTSGFTDAPTDPAAESMATAGMVYHGLGINSLGRLWKDGIVPYFLYDEETAVAGIPDTPYTAAQALKIRNAMDHIEANTSIRFLEAVVGQSYDSAVLMIAPFGTGCVSQVGHMGEETQPLNLDPGCLGKVGGIAHELLHALGLFHEQSRSDRDQYVTINWENIKPEYHSQYAISSTGIDIGPYDYNSIMHYYGFEFQTAKGLSTITVPEGETIGNRKALSQGDIDAIQYLYHTDLELELCSVPEVGPGNSLQAVINVSNLGDADIGNMIARDVKVTMPLPAQSSFDGFTSSDSWSCQQSGQNVECSLDILDRVASTALTLDLTAPTSSASMQLNTTVSASNRDIQSNNNSASASIEIIAGASAGGSTSCSSGGGTTGSSGGGDNGSSGGGTTGSAGGGGGSLGIAWLFFLTFYAAIRPFIRNQSKL